MMKFAQITTLVAIALTNAVAVAANDPARFWISTSMNAPVIGEAPTINAPIGSLTTLYIWATPATDSSGAFRKIEHFSLDVVTQAAPGVPEPEPFIDFVNGTFKVYNEEPGLTKRFQLKTDSATLEEQGGPLLSDKSADQILNLGEPDAIKGLQGLSPNPTPAVVGIGNNGDPSPYRVGNAWRVGEFTFKTLPPDEGKTTVNTLFLQIGYNGIVSSGADDTYVWLGNDTSPDAKYDATCPKLNGCLSQRQLTLGADTFDIRINASAFLPGDYNGDGAVDTADFTYWRNRFGQTVTTPGEGADGNGNGVIDAGDYVFWRKIAASGGGTAAAGLAANSLDIPEPSAFTLICLLASYVFVPPRRRD